MSKKTITCGRCGKSEPVGSAHNARTCGAIRTPQKFPNTEKSYVAPHVRAGGTVTPENSVRSASVKMQKNFPQPSPNPSESRRVAKRGGALPSEGFLNEVWDRDTLVGFDLENGGYQKLSVEDAQRYDHVTVNGLTTWFNEDRVIHREDGPAIVHVDGSMEWYHNGKLHRDGGPAYVGANGVWGWFQHGKLHRVDGPATKNADGRTEWRLHGERTNHPDLCEKATREGLTDEEFYALCVHEDYVVRGLAANNPECPEEWKTLAELKNN